MEKIGNFSHSCKIKFGQGKPGYKANGHMEKLEMENMETGNWKWKLETENGNWKLETRNTKLHG